MKPSLLLALLLFFVGCSKNNQNNGSGEPGNNGQTTLKPKLPKVAEKEASPSAFEYLVQGGQIVITGYNKDYFAKAKSEGNGGVVIPDKIDGMPVTIIGNRAFYRCDGLTSVLIPPTVVNIRLQAFSDCKNLTKVVISEGVTEIETAAFIRCRELKSVTFLGDAPRVGEDIFYFSHPHLAIYYIPGTNGWSKKFCKRPTRRVIMEEVSASEVSAEEPAEEPAEE